MMIKLTNILLELSEPKIKSTIERWKSEDPKVDDKAARALITRFEQVQSGLESKLDILAIPDELKQNNKYKSIDNYSYENMVKMIRSIPENPDKIKKDAIKNFVEKEQIDKPTAQSYTSRFMTNRDRLKYAVENGTEDGHFTKEEVLALIPKNLLKNNYYLDPRYWKWQNFEQMLDAIFPSQKQAGEEDENLASTNADKIYDKNGIEIYKGDDVHKCISYNPINSNTKIKKYGWCVTQVGNTNYDYYRFQEEAPTFYFIFDRSKPSTPEHSRFDDPWHAFVIQVNKDGESYIITNANNSSDTPAETWNSISKIVPSETWAKIKNLKDYFKPISLSAVEKGRKIASGKNLSLDEFKELSQDDKILYIQGKASRNQLKRTPEILKILPKYKIPVGGRTTTLANIAIDNGQQFSYDELKDYPQLAERYAIFRFRHTDYSKTPIPLSFIKYLDEPAKEKYLKTFDGNVTFQYIEKYFGPDITKKYVDEQLKNLSFLPPEASKYITKPELKTLFNTYSKLFDNWKYGYNTSAEVDEKIVDSLYDMPQQFIDPYPFTLNQWKTLSAQNKNTLLKLTENVGNDEKYKVLIYALPYIIKSGDETYLLLPQNEENEYDWVITDINGKVLRKDIDQDNSYIGGNTLNSFSPDEDNFKRVYDIEDVIINDKPLSSNLKESIYDNWEKYSLMRRAGVLK